jgi:hypothetical protein
MQNAAASIVVGQAAQPSGRDAAAVAMWVGLLIVLVVVGSVVVLALRRRMLSNEEESGQGLLLSDLRSLRDRGMLSEAEYEAMRARMTQKAKEAALLDPKVRAQVEALRGKKGKREEGKKAEREEGNGV